MGDKTAFFDTLYTLDSDGACSDEPSNEDQRLAQLFAANRKDRERLLQQFQPNGSNNACNTPQRKDPPPSLLHRHTAPAAVVSSSSSFQDNSHSPKIAAPLRRVNTISELESVQRMPKRGRDEAPAPAAASSSKKPDKKAKRVKTKQPPMQPLEKQVFKTLVFFFIKPDEKRAERKMRMDKAREYGAEVVLEYSNKVTHIIADKDLNYDDVLRFLKFDKVPDEMAVTNPRWPGDCIKHGKLVNPTDFWYQVPGCPEENQFKAPPIRSDGPASSPPPESSGSSSLQVQARPISKLVDTPTSSPPDPRGSSPKPTLPESKPDSPQPVTTESQRDALDEAIEECLADNDEIINIEDYLDDDDTEDNKNHSDTAHSSDSEPATPSKRSHAAANSTKVTSATSNWQSHFQCMHKNDGQEGSQNPNSRTIRVLEEMMRIYDDMRDQWRTRSYRIAISTLKKTQDRYISTYDDAISLSGVGDRLAKKIVEIVNTDRLQRLEYAKLDPQDQILKLFHGIYGVGLVQARKFVAAGYKSLDDVKRHATLTEPQKVGVERYHDFKQRIPREEVAEHGGIVAGVLRDMDEKVESHVMGSYRRGAKDCGDIDIIITKEGAGVEELHEVLEKLVEKLFEQGFLMCGLAIARHDDGTKWHGASKIGGKESTNPWRRIDFLIVPGEEIGAAFLYFTGNDVFNRSMRLLASRMGMRLNQRGLYRDVMRGKNREKFNEGTLLESKSEQKIFEILGVPYRPPEHRIC
ncbi:hypothetical protein H072_5399 [Dactylellina haptotyla CBS 200.50]|uniref:DNA polymerase lambda n=1 Tax=Dactylellina haptotyla (strain CBS 200.50) TaxID=1284197 RepID=S8BMP2_DACHA|nr:hypothetical protein H072_5399 [Dactylellina haptotyla CBS 200.50]